MKTQYCPRCKNKCNVSTQSIELGVLIKCGCGCEFEYLPKKLDDFVSVWTNDSNTSYKHSSVSTIFSNHNINSATPYVISWISHLTLISIWLLISFVLGLSLITTLLFISFILTSFCFKNRKTKKVINEKSIGYFFFDKCFEFFVCFSIVVFFYAGISWMVEGTSDATTLSRLESLEQFVTKIKDFVSYLKIKPWYAALIIFGLIVIDLLVSYFLTFKKSARLSETVGDEVEQTQSTLATRYKIYHTWSKRIYIVAVLLCSFTFFGNSVLGERVAHLRINIDKIREGYTRLKEESEKSLMASVQQKIYEKVIQNLPSDIKDNFNYPKIINVNLNDLRNNNEQLRKYGVPNPDAEKILKDYKVKRSANIPDEPISYDEPKPMKIEVEKKTDIKPKAGTTVESIEKSLAEVETRKTFKTRFVSLLKLDGTKELLVKFPASLTDVTKGKVFGEIFKTHPILEPVIDIFVGTMDKYVETKVKDSAEIVADALLESPEKAEKVLSEESTKIANSIEIKKDKIAFEKLRKFYADIKVRLLKIKEVNQKTQLLLEKNTPKTPLFPATIPTPNTNEELISCYCTCSRNPGVPIFRGTMTNAQCVKSCTGPC